MRPMAEADAAPQQNCPNCGTEVEVGALEPLARVECPQCGEKFRVERAFDNFVVVESLGIGGMGAVYKARDTRLERFVALKLLRKELSADPTEAARLEQEARMTASVNHPNVIQVYSSGSAHGQIYLVMELVDHGSLDDLMAQQTRVPEAQVLQTGIQVARGLQAAHEKGLIHRDVKPANILFADAETAKIGDFGLAGVAEHESEGLRQIWGTPYYVAPERLNNEPEDFRSDIFSLGATLFHAVAGKPPMEGETTSAAELRELKEHPPDLREVAPDVTRETARVINRMLSPDPSGRFDSYRELVEELMRASDVVSGTGHKSRVPFLVGIGLVLLLAMAAGVLILRQRSTPPTLSATVSPPVAEEAAQMERRFEEARRLIIGGKYDQAMTALTKLAIDSGHRQPVQNWSRLHIGLVALLQRKTGPARDAFQQVERVGMFSNAKGDEELARFFLETSRALAAPGLARADTSEVNGKVQALALLLFGLKDWQLSEFGEAAGLLERFVKSEPPNEWKWIGDYKAIAQKYLSDYRLYAEWKRKPPDLMALATLKSGLQTRGALSDALNEEEKRLKSEQATREKEERQIQAQAFANDRTRYLNEWKKRLINDLKTGAFRGEVAVGASKFQGVSGASEQEITLRVGEYGGAAFGWDKFSPSVLLGISKSFIKADAPDAAEREWLVAVYAASTNQIEEAKALADSAAKARPEYEPLRTAMLSGE